MAEYDKMGAGGGGGDMPPAPEAGGEEKNIVMLSADHFPKGMSPKEGDKITFCVTAPPDSEGNVAGYFEGMAGKEDGPDAWEQDFKNEMSPTKPKAEAA